MRGKGAAFITAVATSILILTSLVPAAQAGHDCGRPSACPRTSTPTTLYFHIFDVFNNFPINTQQPNTTFFKVGGTNFPSIVESNTGTNYDFNTIYGYSTAGPVEYEYIENGQPRYHPERGLADDVLIDGNAQHTCGDFTAPGCVRLYVRVLDHVGTGTAPNFMPAYTFRVTVKTLNVLDPTALDAGSEIATGQLTYHLATEEFKDLDGTDINGVKVRTPDEKGIVEYAIPLTFASTTIPKLDGYHVRIDWFQNPSDDPSNDDRAAEGYMRLVMEEGYYPRMELSIMNPVFIEFIHPQVAAGILLIHTAENSPWGTYDVDVNRIQVEIKDKQGNPVDARLERVVSQNAHVHDLHDEPAEVTYLWRFRDEGAADGDYSIKVSVKNLAGTATATDTAGFKLEGRQAYGIDQQGNTVTPAPDPEETEESPGVGFLVVLTLLGAALVVRRRQD